MLRCVVLAAAFAALPAAAQMQRNFPANALRGELVVVQPPLVQLNGKPAQLAPGARIRSETNMLAMSGALVGQRWPVHYTRDVNGDLFDVWLLTPAERAKPWPTSPEQAAKLVFDPIGQTWSKP